MSMTIETKAFSKVLRVLTAGPFTLEEAERTFLEILEAVDANESEKVLMDARDVMGEPRIVERFYYGEFAADAVKRSKQGRTRPGVPQFAYVLIEPVLDPLRLGETVAANRGMNVKAFDNLDAALCWLQLTPDEIKGLVGTDSGNGKH